MRVYKVLAVASMLVFISGPLSPTVFTQSEGPIIHSVTGHGSTSLLVGEPYRDQFSISAIQRADGSLSGGLEYVDHTYEGGLAFHSWVIDLKVVGNVAKLSTAFPP
jgi:hypothetical protein